ncbi:hypothetical protein [Actinomadura logoneensis]|nr:hypothetical protein [Actinomadura logoneensis]
MEAEVAAVCRSYIGTSICQVVNLSMVMMSNNQAVGIARAQAHAGYVAV